MNNANKGRWICRPIGKWTLKLVLVWYLIDKLIIEDLLVNLMRNKSWGRCLKLLYANEIWFSNWSAWISKISALVCGLLFRVDSQIYIVIKKRTERSWPQKHAETHFAKSGHRPTQGYKGPIYQPFERQRAEKCFGCSLNYTKYSLLRHEWERFKAYRGIYNAGWPYRGAVLSERYHISGNWQGIIPCLLFYDGRGLCAYKRYGRIFAATVCVRRTIANPI